MVKYYPLIATLLIDLANSGHIIRMFKEQSSAGQSLVAIMMIILGLFAWERFFKYNNRPEDKFALWSTRIGMAFNAVVGVVVLYFR